MIRRLFTFASASSLLLLFVAVVVFWVRSYRLHDMWAWSQYGPVQIHSVEGGVYLIWGIPHPDDSTPPVRSLPFLREGFKQFWSYVSMSPKEFPIDYAVSANMTVHWNIAGFISAEAEAQWVHANPLWHVIRVPYWALAATSFVCLLGLLRFLWRAWCQSRRAHHGRCTACGYDLRASADRCPECGKPTPAEAKA